MNPALLPPDVIGSPCTNLGVFKNGKVVPVRAKDSGFTHRLNAQWKPQDGLMFYATWSRDSGPAASIAAWMYRHMMRII